MREVQCKFNLAMKVLDDENFELKPSVVRSRVTDNGSEGKAGQNFEALLEISVIGGLKPKICSSKRRFTDSAEIFSLVSTNVIAVAFTAQT